MKFQPRPTFRKVSRECRENSHERGYGHRWQRYSQARLHLHPLCATCGNAAQATDHIQPVSSRFDSNFWKPDNHQSLCWSCHSRKTATEVNGQQLRVQQ